MCLARDKRFNLTSGLESEDSIIITKSYCKVVLNQRAKRIHVFGLWQEVQLDLKVQEMNYHHKAILQSNFQSESEQDLCVGIVTRDSFDIRT